MTSAEITGRLEALGPTIRARRGEIEDARRLPPDLADALRHTQVFAMSVPRTIGGLQALPADILRAIETVSAADGSTGWCTGRRRQQRQRRLHARIRRTNGVCEA